MKTIKQILYVTAALLLLAVGSPAQTISNPSFEADNFATFPGYISGNAAITGWTANDNTRAGLNPAGGSPFADNGTVPNGNNVAFLQWGGSGGGTELSTPISGLTVGTTYKVTFRVNARNGNAPYLRVRIDGLKIVDMGVSSVGDVNPYKFVAFDFTATAPTQILFLRNDALEDNTVVVDDFTIAPSSGKWSFSNWNSDASSGVDPAYTYTHAYSFGSDVSATINGVVFTGVAGGNPSVADQFSTAGFDGVFGSDANNVIGGSRTLATDFVYGGPVHTLTINGLTPGTEYVATIFGVGFDAAPATRAATFSVGDDMLTVNDDHYGDNNGVRISYRYTADETGSITLTYVPTSTASSFHTYGFCNRTTTKAELPSGLLLSDSFDGTGTIDTMNLNYNLIARQLSPLGLIGYVPSGNAQVGNTGEPHDGGNVLLLAFGATASPLYNFNNALSAGGLKISFDLDPNAHSNPDTTTWGAVVLGASLADRHGFVVGAGHFGMLLRANGGLQAFDGGNLISDPAAEWAPLGDYSLQMHHFDLVITDPTDNDPFNGAGNFKIDVYVDNDTENAVFSWTKPDGDYVDNYMNFQVEGPTIADVDNLVIAQLNPSGPPPVNPWSFAPWNDDGSSGVIDGASGIKYTHAYNYSPSRDASINNVLFNRIWFGNPGIPGRFTTTGFPNGLTDDPDGAGGPAPTLSCTGSINLGNDFLYNGNPATITLNGLVPGREYVLSFFASTWGGQGGRVLVFSNGGDQRAIDQNAFSGRNGIVISYTYTATAETMTITVSPLGADTFHCYGFCNRETTPGADAWSYAAWTSDATSGVSPLYNYTHAYNFNSGVNPTINTIPFTGVGGANPGVSGVFTSSGLPNTFPNDTGNTVTGAGRDMANDFLYGGLPMSLTLQGLTPGKAYVLSLFSTAWEGPANRFIGFGAAGGLKVIDQDAFYSNGRNGIVISYAYTADASGSVTVEAGPLVGASTFHCYGFANREAEPKPLPPVITVQPRSVYVAEGQNLVLTADAIANPPPSFFWLSNEVPMLEATGTTLDLSPAVPAFNADYKFVAYNDGGWATSEVATVRVGLPMPNSSFETDTYTNYPGYLYGNFAITDWSFTGSPRLGINPGTWGGGPFADNGIIPHGNQVLFIQDPATVSQTVSGFTEGTAYYLVYYENARNCCGGVPAVEVTIDDGVNPPMVIVPKHPVTPVGPNNNYQLIQSVGFTAASANIKVSFTKSDWVAGDSTLLLDSVCFFEQPAGVSPVIEIQPQAASALPGSSAKFAVVAYGSPDVAYQWYKDELPINGATAGFLDLGFVSVNDDGDYKVVVSNGSGSVTSDVVHLLVTIPLIDLFNTGVDANGNVLSDGSVDSHYILQVNPDNAASVDAFVEDTTIFPIVSGPWLGVNNSSKWIGPRTITGNTVGAAEPNALVGDYVYTTAIDLTGRDPSTVFIEGYWSSDNAGTGIAVNGVDTGIVNDGNFAAWHYFKLDSGNATFTDGLNFIDFKVNNGPAVGYTGLRVEIAASHGKLLPWVSPIIVQEPQGTEAALGDTVVLSAIVVGGAPMSFQWKKDGQVIDGQTSGVLVLTGVTLETSGNYTLEINNDAGSAVTQTAFVWVNRERVPGIFGTGVDDNGQLLLDGAPEQHYILTTSADPEYLNAVTVNNAYPIVAGAWVLNGPTSRWIAPQANQNDGSGGGNAEGDYTYTMAFDLTGVDLSRFSLMGAWATDNAGVMVLNGVNINSIGSFNVLTPFSISSGFVPGVNFMDFIVHNNPATPNPTGLRVDLAGYLAIKPLSVERSDTSEVTVNWTVPAWKLQWTDSLSTPNWQDIPNAVSPFKTNTVDNPTMFFRITPP